VRSSAAAAPCSEKGPIELDDVRDMLAWEKSGFSLDAAVRGYASSSGQSGRSERLGFLERLGFPIRYSSFRRYGLIRGIGY
jgi:hypothetical protein